MRRKGNPPAWLVGMKISAVPMKNSTEFAKKNKKKNRTTITLAEFSSVTQ